MQENNVLSWNVALRKGLQPGLYPYEPGSVPLGEVSAVLDFKIWAKKIMGICCYFTEAATGRKFQLSVYCKFSTARYMVEDSNIDFSVCPVNCIYSLTIGFHPTGRRIIERVVLLQ